MHERSTVRGDSESRPRSKHTAHSMFVFVLLHCSLLCSCELQIACCAALNIEVRYAHPSLSSKARWVNEMRGDEQATVTDRPGAERG